jgi:hypothetical protein
MADNAASASRFFFRGNAVPLGGRVISVAGKPAAQAVPTPCTSSLPGVGGFSRAEATGSSFQNIFTWGPCVTESRGDVLEDGSHVTMVTSSVMDATATNNPIKFQAGELTAVVTSKYPRRGLPSIYLDKIVFGGDKGLYLDGKRIEVHTDLDDFQRCAAFDQFEKSYRSDEGFYRKYALRTARSSGKSAHFGEPLPRRPGGYVLTSIVNSIVWGDKTFPGHVLTLTGFGSIYFGEILLNEYNRRLTLVRLKMGSDVDAEMEYAGVDTNGSFEP